MPYIDRLNRPVDTDLRNSPTMREIQASEAQVQFLQLLDDVVCGETLAITRYGKTMARLEPLEQSVVPRDGGREY